MKRTFFFFEYQYKLCRKKKWVGKWPKCSQVLCKKNMNFQFTQHNSKNGS